MTSQSQLRSFLESPQTSDTSSPGLTTTDAATLIARHVPHFIAPWLKSKKKEEGISRNKKKLPFALSETQR